MQEHYKIKLTFILKYLVGLILLVWILARIDRKQMLVALTGIPFSVMVIMLVVAFLNLIGQFLRWKFLVENHSSDFNKKDLIPSFFAGFAFRLILPGGHAEITKVFLLSGKKKGKVVAFGIEKFFQTYIKIVLVCSILPLFLPLYQTFLWTLAAIAFLAYFFLPQLFKLSILKKFQEKEVNYHRIFLQTLLYSLAIFWCLIIQYYLILNEFHFLGLRETVYTVIFIWGSGLIPISISGLGVRENVAVYFLKQYDFPAHAAVAASLLIFFINSIIPALIGLIFIIKRQKDLKDAPATFKMVSKSIYESGRQRFNGKKNKTKKDFEQELPTESYK